LKEVRKTSLYDEHLKLNARMISFAGYEMPIQYEGLVAEHNAVRNHCGIFDVSHMGEVFVKGKEATKFLDYLLPADLTKLETNQVCYSFMCYEDGGTVDDLIIYKYSEEKYLLVINASNIDKDFNWINVVAVDYDVELDHASKRLSEVAIQGPKAQEVLQNLVDFSLDEIEFFRFRELKILDKEVIVSRTGYTGEDGFEIYAKNEDIVEIWQGLIKLGATPCGLGCRDTLRFEVALPLYGNELSLNITPVEAGLGFFVSKEKKGDYIGKETLLKQKLEGASRKIVGFEMLGRGIPRQGYDVLVEGEIIGEVTTGYLSPSLNKNIGLALIDAKYAGLEKKFEVQIRKKRVEAIQVSKRFYKKQYKK